MYFPWGKDQKLLADQDNFDHKPYQNMQAYAPDFDVRLWTHEVAREFCLREFPDIWSLIESAPRPMMMVDLLRWLVVWRFGGIYWQYDLNSLTRMDHFFPSEEKKVRLFTEFILTEEQSRMMAKEPIRGGEPEEPVRVLNQVFSAEPGHPFIRSVVDLIADRIRNCEMKKDYDLLFISANAVVSTAYDRYGKNDSSVELLPRDAMRSMVKVAYRGTWRTDFHGSDTAAALTASRQPPWRSLAIGIKNRQPITRLYYRWISRHGHEISLGEDGTEAPALGANLSETFLAMGIHSVLEYPTRRMSKDRIDIWTKLRYIGGDPSRDISAENQRQFGRSDTRFIFMNLLFSRIPKTDCLVLGDSIERMPHHDILSILLHVAGSGIRYIVMPTHPYMNNNWDTALGDPRPINFLLSPYNFPTPGHVITAMPGCGRSDRVLGLWSLTDLAGVV